VSELTKSGHLVAAWLQRGGAPESEGRWRGLLEQHHGTGVLEDLRMGQEGVMRGLLMVNYSGKSEEAGGGTYQQ
jgi:hypothetical protein